MQSFKIIYKYFYFLHAKIHYVFYHLVGWFFSNLFLIITVITFHSTLVYIKTLIDVIVQKTLWKIAAFFIQMLSVDYLDSELAFHFYLVRLIIS